MPQKSHPNRISFQGQNSEFLEEGIRRHSLSATIAAGAAAIAFVTGVFKREVFSPSLRFGLS